MTTPQRFERELPELLGDLYVGGMPDYRDDLLRRTEATSQRPAWSFPTRWIPMDLTMRRVAVVPVAWRAIAIALLILALIAAAVFVGSQRRVPPPFGPAANGSMFSSIDGDIVVRDGVTGPSRVLIGGTATDTDAGASPDGSLLAFIRTTGKDPFLMVANIDGSNARRVHATPLGTSAWANWAPDSKHLGLIDVIDGRERFVLVPADGSAERVVPTGGLTPLEFAFRPPDGHEVLVRAYEGGLPDLYLMNVDGTNARKLGLRNNGGDRELAGASWSPDGTRLAFTVTVRNPMGKDRFRVHLLTLATMQEVELPGPADTTVNQAWPQWSPDGSLIMVQRFTDTSGWIGLLPADRSTAGRDVITPMAFDNDTQLDDGWSPDGTSIVIRFDVDRIYSIDVATGRRTDVTWPINKIPDWQRLAP